MIRNLRVATAGLVSLAAVGSGVLLTPAQAVLSGSMTVTVGAAPGTTAQWAGQFDIGGDSAADISIEQVDGGRAVTVPGPSMALPSAIQFPSYSDSATYPRAAIGLTPTVGQALSPGSSDFEYGAVFRLDETSSGDTLDNGDNLFQRGLHGEGSQFKLQIDHRYPSCVVSGSAGRALVRSQVKVTPDEWYRVTCTRIGSEVTVAVTSYGSGDIESTSTIGGTGTLTFDASRPASIGGKLSPSGSIAANASDQFNGAVAKVWIKGL